MEGLGAVVGVDGRRQGQAVCFQLESPVPWQHLGAV